MRRYVAAILTLLISCTAFASEPSQAMIDRFLLAVQLSEGHRIEEMIQAGFPVNFRFEAAGRSTPLHLVVAGPDRETAEFLMEAGADLYAYDEANDTPFMVALRRGNRQITDSMIDRHGYDVDTPVGPLLEAGFEDLATPLTYVAMNGDRQTVTYLLEKGADETGPAEFLLHATAANQFQTVEGYASTPFGLNRSVRKYNDSTALFIANENSNDEMVIFLLERGADLLARNAGGMTAFDVAIAIGDYDLARLYLDEYAYNVDEVGPFDRTALFHVTVGNPDIDATQFLLEQGADPNLLQYDGSNFLHVYISDRLRNDAPIDTEFLELYLEHGFDPNRPDGAGYTFVHTLAMQPDPSLFELLSGFELDLDAAELILGATPVAFAVQSGNLETAQQLLVMGADPNIPYENGRTPLSYAVENNEEEMVRLLAGFGADFMLQDEEGKSPLDYVSAELRERILDLLP